MKRTQSNRGFSIFIICFLLVWTIGVALMGIGSFTMMSESFAPPPLLFRLVFLIIPLGMSAVGFTCLIFFIKGLRDPKTSIQEQDSTFSEPPYDPSVTQDDGVLIGVVPNYCPNCGTRFTDKPVDSDLIHCPECGTSFSTSS